MNANEQLVERLVSQIFNERDDHFAILKANILRIAADHRDNCQPGCAITLRYLWEVADLAGISFTLEEMALFA